MCHEVVSHGRADAVGVFGRDGVAGECLQQLLDGFTGIGLVEVAGGAQVEVAIKVTEPAERLGDGRVFLLGGTVLAVPAGVAPQPRLLIQVSPVGERSAGQEVCLYEPEGPFYARGAVGIPVGGVGVAGGAPANSAGA